MPVLCPAVAFHPVFDTMPFYTYNKYYVNTNEYRRDMNLGYIIFTIYFLAILAVLYFIPKRRQMKQAKKNGSLTGAMGGQAAYTKEQQFLAKEQFAAYRKTVYAYSLLPGVYLGFPHHLWTQCYFSVLCYGAEMDNGISLIYSCAERYPVSRKRAVYPAWHRFL